MKTLTDERIAIEQHVAESTHEQLADELENNCNCLHQAKEVCNNARIRLPKAIEELELAMRILGQPHNIGGPISKALAAVTLTLADMKDVKPMAASERHVVQFMQELASANNLSHFSIQLDRPDGTRKGKPSYYCNRRGHSGQSSSLELALGSIKLEMSRLGEEG